MITMSDCNSWHIYMFYSLDFFYSLVILFINISNTVAENIKQIKREQGYDCCFDKERDNFTPLLWLQNDNPSLGSLGRCDFGGVLNVFKTLMIHTPD